MLVCAGLCVFNASLQFAPVLVLVFTDDELFDTAGRGALDGEGVGEVIISSGLRARRLASRGESGEGELRRGDDERGEEVCGVYSACTCGENALNILRSWWRL